MEKLCKTFLNSIALRVVMESGICKGGLKYVREHILITLLSVDSVRDEYDLSKLSGCSLDQCKCVLDTLRESGLLTIEEDESVSLRDYKNRLGFQKTDSRIVLSEEEEKNLRVIIGESFIFYKNMAQDYKMYLINLHRPIMLCDYSLVLRAFKDKWDVRLESQNELI